jgi:hypothetical protein
MFSLRRINYHAEKKRGEVKVYLHPFLTSAKGTVQIFLTEFSAKKESWITVCTKQLDVTQISRVAALRKEKYVTITT